MHIEISDDELIIRFAPLSRGMFTLHDRSLLEDIFTCCATFSANFLFIHFKFNIDNNCFRTLSLVIPVLLPLIDNVIVCVASSLVNAYSWSMVVLISKFVSGLLSKFKVCNLTLLLFVKLNDGKFVNWLLEHCISLKQGRFTNKSSSKVSKLLLLHMSISKSVRNFNSVGK